MSLQFPSLPDIHTLIKLYGLDERDLDPLLEVFCSCDLIENEIKLLLKNPLIITYPNEQLVNQIAILANSRGDVLTAYRYHRKSVILSVCHIHGLDFLKNMLSDPKRYIIYFELIGPPPGQDNNYWDRLISAYDEGDNYLASRLRNINNFCSISKDDASCIKDLETLLPPVLIPLIPKDGDKNAALELIKKQILDKYLSSDSKCDIKENLNEMSKFFLESLQKKREILYQIISNNQLMTLFNNWICGMTSEEFLQYFNSTMDQWLNLYSPLDEYLSFRQRTMSLSELLDCNLLVADKCQLLLEILTRVALGEENNWTENSQILSEITEREFEAYSANHHTQTLLESLEWISSQELKNWSHPCAFIKLEYMAEQLVINHQPQDTQQLITRKKMDFENYSQIFKTYRTRSMQLVMLGLFQKLKDSLVKNFS